ncbi:hypothetical protein HanHA300_Chr08g0275901 [Helianthus annuus]|nr:hypothetical protein HanHA300_Chr08g0275901 [Helianthus annuus]
MFEYASSLGYSNKQINSFKTQIYHFVGYLKCSELEWTFRLENTVMEPSFRPEFLCIFSPNRDKV